MSRAYGLICRETKQSVCIGQGGQERMHSFYSDDSDAMQKLGLFLIETQGKQIELKALDAEDEFLDYDEF